MNIETYPVDQIDVGARLRATNQDRVAEIALSISERGLLQPIGLSPEANGRRKLVFGAHRLAAFKACTGVGRDIPFIEREGTADELRMMEIDENLYRHELTAADEAEFLTERADIFSRLHGRRKPGRKGNDAKLAQLDFFAELESLFGLRKRSVQMKLARRTNIDDKAWAALRGTPIAENGSWLDALGRLEDPRLQLAAVHAVTVRGEAATIPAAIALVTQAEPPASVSMFEKLVRRWPKLDEDEQQRIKAWIAKQPTVATVG